MKSFKSRKNIKLGLLVSVGLLTLALILTQIAKAQENRLGKHYGKDEAEARLEHLKRSDTNATVIESNSQQAHYGPDFKFKYWIVTFRSDTNLCIFDSTIHLTQFTEPEPSTTCDNHGVTQAIRKLHFKQSDVVD